MQRTAPAKVIFFLILLCSCGPRNPLGVDVSSINVPAVKIRRFDRAVFSLAQGDLEANTQRLLHEYGDFYEGFVRNIICRGGTKDSAYAREIKRFVTDPDLNLVYEECKKKFDNLDDIEAALRDVFRHYKYYFPPGRLPIPVAAFTGLSYPMAVADSFVAFSAEMYLGRDSKIYDMAQVPLYQRRNMNRENIVPDFIKGWMLNEFPQKDEKNNLLSEMIYQGRIVYLIDAMMPDADDTIKIGFSKNQLDWCKRNEGNMWGFLLKNQLLYSESSMDIAQFTHEGPFTTGFAKESPARTGVWLGWQIVRSYMRKNPDTTLAQLMLINDAQKILDASRYKPASWTQR